MRVVITLLAVLATGLAAMAGAHAAPESPDMLTIPAGRFIMGSSDAETTLEQSQTMHTGIPLDDDFAPREKPQHAVTVKAFKLAKYLVTRADFARFVYATGYAVAGKCWAYNFAVDPVKFGPSATADWRDPGFKQTDKDPVVCVSHDDAVAYITWYSAQTGLTYRLPTEAETEYATRAGTTTSRYWGDDVALQCKYANGSDQTVVERFKDRVPKWYGAPCDDGYLTTSPVDAFPPNPWGLYDMLGNVYELTQDCWHDTYDGAPTDGSAWLGGDCHQHAARGGSTSPHPGSMRSASRVMMNTGDRSVFGGFRLARSLE
ncbi:MAG: formylglycine-generating enzyme family protein [Azospirillaceae bacterium]|nr:formylglycine-generating enzyme family protein [Azospirillaceae bacterium]